MLNSDSEISSRHYLEIIIIYFKFSSVNFFIFIPVKIDYFEKLF